MKKLVVLVVSFFIVSLAIAQDTLLNNSIIVDTVPAPEAPRPEPVGRSKDHLLIQFGMAGWAQQPDSISTKGLSRAFNIYFMFDFPFKTNPKMSIAVGAGISSSNIYFDKTEIDIAGKRNNELTFRDVSDTNYFKKYKLLTTYLEAPVELRYTANPEQPNKSFKIAIGGKVGTMLSAGTKGKNLLNRAGQNVNAYTQKEKSKRFFNGTRISATARVGYGVFSLFGSYQINSFVKEGFGPDVRPFMAGITISGL